MRASNFAVVLLDLFPVTHVKEHAYAGQLVNRLGRKDTIIFSSLGFVIGFLLIEVSPLPNVMFLGRFLTGLSTGITALAVPVFVSEVSPPQIRGVLNTLCTIAVTSGVLMAYVLGKWLDYQWLATACIVPSVIVVSTMPFVADSPRWLIQRGRSEEALKVRPRLPPLCQIEFALYKFSLEKAITTVRLFIRGCCKPIQELLLENFGGLLRRQTHNNERR